MAATDHDDIEGIERIAHGIAILGSVHSHTLSGPEDQDLARFLHIPFQHSAWHATSDELD